MQFSVIFNQSLYIVMDKFFKFINVVKINMENFENPGL